MCISGVATAFNGPAIPREVPFIENNVTYTSYIQTWHPWYSSSTIVYFPENVNPALYPVGVDYNQGVPYQHIRILLNPASYDQAWDSTNYNANTYYYTWHAGMQTWLYYGQSASIKYAQYTWFDWNYAGPTGYDLREDLVRVYGVDLKVNFSYDWDGQFELPNLSAGDYILQGTTRPFSILSPVEGALEVVYDINDCTGDRWCFNQHGTGAHVPDGGIGDSDDSYAWDANLDYPMWDSDDGVDVYAVAPGIVAATYAGATNAGGTYGQVLIEHTHNGNTWWSGYLHLDNIQVNVDDEITENTVLGEVSDIGSPSVNHLHFVVYTGENSSEGLESFDPQIIER